MNILVIAHYQNDGSPYVSFVHDQVLAYKELGHNVCVISPMVYFKKYTNSIKNVKYLNIDGIEVYYPKYFSFSKYGKYGLNNILGYRVIDKILKKKQKEFTVDVIHAHTIGFDGAISVRLKDKYHIPTFITTHGSDTILEIKKGKASYITGICNRADIVIAVSSMLKDLLKKEDKSINIDVILNGFNVQYSIERPKKQHSIIQVSSLIKRKKVDTTLKVIAELKKYYNDISLTVIGEGPEDAYLKELCNKLDITENVVFLGQVPNSDVLSRMSEAEVFIMPSTGEGLGIVYLEAMSCGCITIGTKGEGIQDIIVNEKNGFLIEPDDYKIIAENVIRCFNDNVLKQEIIQNAKDSVKDLTWIANAKKYIELFKKIRG
ncbi:MAG: glycosyl transferase group 1 [Herbinix sp.]|jgi:glycosyltransferase involved in cell wall biosynthesis|nr:glycosyl transferase group 1 [Herbinix sp.]